MNFFSVFSTNLQKKRVWNIDGDCKIIYCDHLLDSLWLLLRVLLLLLGSIRCILSIMCFFFVSWIWHFKISHHDHEIVTKYCVNMLLEGVLQVFLFLFCLWVGVLKLISFSDCKLCLIDLTVSHRIGKFQIIGTNFN